MGQECLALPSSTPQSAPPASVPTPPPGLRSARPGCISISTSSTRACCPAVSYPQPLGLDWDELLALMRPLVAAPNLLGLSVADFNPDRDADGTHAARVGEALESLCRG